MNIFVSTENTADGRVARLLHVLARRDGTVVVHSPLNPLNGHDPRWTDWYAQGCPDAIAAADVFVAVETAGYDSSTWMAHEFAVAWKLRQERGRPQLCLWKIGDAPLPRGFAQYEAEALLLPSDADRAVEALVAPRPG